jgi:hypothetical protein
LADAIFRNDEVVGSIPTSSTKFSITYRHPLTRFCPKLVQNNFQRWVPGLASLQPRRNKKGGDVSRPQAKWLSTILLQFAFLGPIKIFTPCPPTVIPMGALFGMGYFASDAKTKAASKSIARAGSSEVSPNEMGGSFSPGRAIGPDELIATTDNPAPPLPNAEASCGPNESCSGSRLC